MVPLQNINTLDTVLTCSRRVYSFLLPVIWTIMVIHGLRLRDIFVAAAMQLHNNCRLNI